MSKKIRDAQTSKVKIQIVIGDEEVESKTLSLRFYGEQQVINIKANKLIDYLEKLRNEKK